MSLRQKTPTKRDGDMRNNLKGPEANARRFRTGKGTKTRTIVP